MMDVCECLTVIRRVFCLVHGHRENARPSLAFKCRRYISVNSISLRASTRSAVAEGPRDALCQSQWCKADSRRMTLKVTQGH